LSLLDVIGDVEDIPASDIAERSRFAEVNQDRALGVFAECHASFK
jgi:hypothetical protein